MKNVIFDTNILVYREDPNKLDRDIVELGKVFSESNDFRVVIHPTSMIEAELIKNKDLRDQIISKLKTYKILDIKLKTTKDFYEKFGNPTKINDVRDIDILHSLYRGAASYIITNDTKFRKRAKKIKLEDKVLSIEKAIKHFYTDDTDGITKPIYILKEKLSNIPLEDEFFNSLKIDYEDFEGWYLKKAEKGESAYISYNNQGSIGSFLLLKTEDERDKYEDFEKPLESMKTVKVSTLKVYDKGKRLGERYIRIIIDYALKEEAEQIYVTVFEKHKVLVNLFVEYGFHFFTTKETKHLDGTTSKESIYVKKMTVDGNFDFSDMKNYPFACVDSGTKSFVIPIRPEYHIKLFPDYTNLYQLSIDDLTGEKAEAYAIKKVYISSAKRKPMAPGDLIFFYRSRDFSSITSVGVVELFYGEINNFKDFSTIIHKRTAYTKYEMQQQFQNHKCIILFKHLFDFKNQVELNDLLENAILKGPPQTITKINREALIKLSQISNDKNMKKFIKFED